MLPLIAPVLSTPLLKVPLLMSYAYGTYHGMTPPNSRPDQREKQRVVKPGGLWADYPQLHMTAVAASKYALCALALTEAATLVAQHTGLLPDDVHPLLASVTRVQTLRLTPASAAGCLFAAVGGITRMWCHYTLGKLFTWEISVRDDHKLVTSGPYAIVRHPSYTGWLFIFGGTVMLLMSNGSYFVESGMWDTPLGKAAVGGLVVWWSAITAGLLERPPLEDELMKKEFGSEWEKWAKMTPYRLIPFIY